MSAHLTIQEFQVAMTKIVQNPPWKRTYAGGDILDLIYDKVNHVKFEQFKTICERLLGSSRSAPLVPDFEKAVIEMGYVKYSPRTSAPQHHSVVNNYLYHLQGDVWADDNFIYIRGSKPSFIVKRDEKGNLVNNPYVQLDTNVRAEKLKEVEGHIKNKTYADYIKNHSPTPSRTTGLTLMNFDQYKEAK